MKSGEKTKQEVRRDENKKSESKNRIIKLNKERKITKEKKGRNEIKGITEKNK